MRNKVTIYTSNRLQRKLARPTFLAAPVRDYWEDVLDYGAHQAEYLAPEGVTGYLQRSHEIELEDLPIPGWGVIRAVAPYASFVAEGTKPHWAPIKALRPWAEEKGINVYALQWSIARKGTRAHPWFPEVRKLTLAYARMRLGVLTQRIKATWER